MAFQDLSGRQFINGNPENSIIVQQGDGIPASVQNAILPTSLLNNIPTVQGEQSFVVQSTEGGVFPLQAQASSVNPIGPGSSLPSVIGLAVLLASVGMMFNTMSSVMSSDTPDGMTPASGMMGMLGMMCPVCPSPTSCPVTTQAPVCVPKPDCPDGFMKVSANGKEYQKKCFLFSRKKLMFMESITFCVMRGGMLATIDNVEEAVVIKNYLKNNYPGEKHTVAYTDLPSKKGMIKSLTGSNTDIPGFTNINAIKYASLSKKGYPSKVLDRASASISHVNIRVYEDISLKMLTQNKRSKHFDCGDISVEKNGKANVHTNYCMATRFTICQADLSKMKCRCP